MRYFLPSNETHFKNRDMFDIDYVPEQFNYREAQLKDLVFAINPALHGARPKNAVIRGLPGTGKTSSVRILFTDLEASGRRIVPVHVNCQIDHTKYMIFARIFHQVFGHAPPMTGISIRQIIDRVGRKLTDQKQVLLVCLDDANFIQAEGLLNHVIYSILRIHEAFPGLKTGVLLAVSDVDIEFQKVLDPATLSVLQPTEVYFPPYSEEAICGILRERVHHGLFPGVLPDDVFDLIVEKTSGCGDIRVGIETIRSAVMAAERERKQKVEEKHVESAFEVSQYIHLRKSLTALSSEEKRMYHQMAVYSMEPEHMMTSGAVFASVSEKVPMGYTVYYNRLKKLEDMRLINMHNRNVGGRTREITLRYDAEKVVEECGG